MKSLVRGVTATKWQTRMQTQAVWPQRTCQELLWCEFSICLLNEQMLNEWEKSCQQTNNPVSNEQTPKDSSAGPQGHSLPTSSQTPQLQHRPPTHGEQRRETCTGISQTEDFRCLQTFSHRMEKRTAKKRICWQLVDSLTAHNSHHLTTCLLERDNQVHLPGI